jgi:hypothetical protein
VTSASPAAAALRTLELKLTNGDLAWHAATGSNVHTTAALSMRNRGKGMSPKSNPLIAIHVCESRANDTKRSVPSRA